MNEMINKILTSIVKQATCNPLDVITIILTLTALFFAWYIPRRIMVNQLYANLVSEYRSTEMGAAVLALFYFYVHDCNRAVDKINEQYKIRYDREIGNKIKNKEEIDYKNTLHFQRRLVAQYYSDMANLRYEYRFPRLTKKQLLNFVTPRENHLLSLLLHMSNAATEVFEESGDIQQPPEGDVKLNQLIYQLYEETEELV